jgi:KUP system potassium uptake protein
MTTWRRGVEAMKTRILAMDEPPAGFLQRLADGSIPRVPGTAVFLSRNKGPVPVIMVRHVKDMGALHKTLASITLRFEEVPRVPQDRRVDVEHVADNFWHLTAHYGFVEIPDLSAVLRAGCEQGCDLDLGGAIIFAAHDDVVPGTSDRLLPPWRRMLFTFMYRNAVRTTDRFHLPTQRFVEVGRQVRV